MKTAILVDGGFFKKRYHIINGFSKNDGPSLMAKNLRSYCIRHIVRINKTRSNYNLPPTQLYRIYYYDSSPYQGDAQNPVSGKSFSFKKTPEFLFQNEFLKHLKEKRKVALRLGFLKNNTRKQWVIRSRFTKNLISNKISISDLKAEDLEFPLKQKAVDMKIGLDIATLAFKEQVSQIVLIAGDSDFVPAAKFARREGVDFILDPMQNPIDPTLFEHIDGLMSIKDMTYNEPKGHSAENND